MSDELSPRIAPGALVRAFHPLGCASACAFLGTQAIFRALDPAVNTDRLSKGWQHQL